MDLETLLTYVLGGVALAVLLQVLTRFIVARLQGYFLEEILESRAAIEQAQRDSEVFYQIQQDFYPLTDPAPYQQLIQKLRESLLNAQHTAKLCIHARSQLFRHLPPHLKNIGQWLVSGCGPWAYHWGIFYWQVKQVTIEAQDLQPQNIKPVADLIEQLDKMPEAIAARCRQVYTEGALGAQCAEALSRAGFHGETFEEVRTKLQHYIRELELLPPFFYSIDAVGNELEFTSRNAAIKQGTIQTWEFLERLEIPLKSCEATLSAWQHERHRIGRNLESLNTIVGEARAALDSVPNSVMLTSEQKDAYQDLWSQHADIKQRYLTLTVEQLSDISQQIEHLQTNGIALTRQAKLWLERYGRLVLALSQSSKLLHIVLAEMKQGSEATPYPIAWAEATAVEARRLYRLRLDAGTPETSRQTTELESHLQAAETMVRDWETLQRTVEEALAQRVTLIGQWQRSEFAGGEGWKQRAEAAQQQVKASGFAVENWAIEDAPMTVQEKAMELLARQQALIPASERTHLAEVQLDGLVRTTKTLLAERYEFQLQVKRVFETLEELQNQESKLKQTLDSALRALNAIVPFDEHVLSDSGFTSLIGYYKQLDPLRAEGQQHLVTLLQRAVGKVRDKAKRIQVWYRRVDELINGISREVECQYEALQHILQEEWKKLEAIASFKGEEAARQTQEWVNSFALTRPVAKVVSSDITQLEDIVTQVNTVASELPRLFGLVVKLEEIKRIVQESADFFGKSREKAHLAFDNLEDIYTKTDKWPRLTCNFEEIKEKLQLIDREAKILRDTGESAKGIRGDLKELAEDYKRVEKAADRAREELLDQQEDLNRDLQIVQNFIDAAHQMLRMHKRVDSPFTRALDKQLREFERECDDLVRNKSRDSYNNFKKRLVAIKHQAEALLGDNSPVLQSDNIQEMRKRLLRLEDPDIDDLCDRGRLARIGRTFSRGMHKTEKIKALLAGCLQDPVAAKELYKGLNDSY